MGKQHPYTVSREDIGSNGIIKTSRAILIGDFSRRLFPVSKDIVDSNHRWGGMGWCIALELITNSYRCC